MAFGGGGGGGGGGLYLRIETRGVLFTILELEDVRRREEREV